MSSANAADRVDPRRLLRRRRAGRLRQVHHRLLPQSPDRRTRIHELLRNRDGLMRRHLQRLPGADQAGSGALRRDLAQRRTASATLTFNTIGRHQSRAGAHPRRLQHSSPWLHVHPARRRLYRARSPTARGGLSLRTSCWLGSARNGQIATQYCRPRRQSPTMDSALQPQRLASMPSRASPRPTAACSARWATASAWAIATRCT